MANIYILSNIKELSIHIPHFSKHSTHVLLL